MPRHGDPRRADGSGVGPKPDRLASAPVSRDIILIDGDPVSRESFDRAYPPELAGRGAAVNARSFEMPRDPAIEYPGDVPWPAAPQASRAPTRGAGQSRRASAVESVANVLVGYGVAVATQIVVFPWFGIHVQVRTQLGIGAAFTAVSLVRAYLLRRVFNLAALRA